MTGQDNLKNIIKNQISKGAFPRFSILVGPKGSGRKLLCMIWLPNQLHAQPVPLGDVKVDTIRYMIEESHKQTEPTLYIIPDADNMSVAAKNALLKVTEEPPNNAYFVITLTNLDNTLETIKSRGTVFMMDRYTPLELEDYSKARYNSNDECNWIVKNVCESPGEVDLLHSFNIQDFYHYVEKVVQNIAEVSGSNAFKIAEKIAFKDEDDKYNLNLFWNAFRNVCTQQMQVDEFDEMCKYANGVLITTKYIQKLRVTGVRKDSLFDMWLLDIRREWM